MSLFKYSKFSNTRFYYKVHNVFEEEMTSLSWLFGAMERVCKQAGRQWTKKVQSIL